MTIPDQEALQDIQEAAPINQDEALETVGEYLKKTRLARKERLEEIASSLRISKPYLESFEADDQAHLPEQVYTLGFLKSYANYLGLDANEIIARYKRQFSRPARPEALTFPAPLPTRTVPSTLLILIGIGLAVLAVIAWFSIQSGREASAPTAVIPSDQNFSQIYPTFPIQDARPYEDTRAAKAIIEGKNIFLSPGQSLIVLASVDTWVEIKTAAGKVLVSKTFKAGESEEFETKQGLTLSTENAGGISFYVNGKYFTAVGKPGEVLKNMELQFKEPEAK